MSKSARSKQPLHDRTEDALFTLAETLLDDFFSDPDMQIAFEVLSRRGRKPGVRNGEDVPLASMELSDHGDARLSMRAGSREVTVTIAHPRFNASIAAQYDPDKALTSGARILQIDGDRAKALACADKWFDEIDESLLDDTGEELAGALADFVSDDGSPFEGQDDPGEPPPPSAQDRMVVETLAKALAREMKRKKPDMMSHHDDLLVLEQSPQSLWPILDGMVAACTAGPRDEALVDAWRFLLEGQLTLIRYRIDGGWGWAQRMAEEYQQRLIQIGESGRIASEDFATMVGALGEAGIDVKPDARVALADAGLTMPDQHQPAELTGLVRGLIDQMASAVSDPFEAATALNEATRVMPAELRCFMAHEFALSSHAVMRDTVPLMLLAEEQEVRRAAAAALRQTAVPDTMSSEALRRMIAIRNWLPEDDRPPLDQAIRQARRKDVECAPWPASRDLMITASMIDGSGAQSILLTSRGGREGVLAGVLLKASNGVAESWCGTGAPRRDINETLATMRKAGLACEVDRAYLDKAVQHAIGIGTSTARPPGAALLQIAEFAGGAEWRDRRLDVAAETKILFDGLSAEQRSSHSVETSLRRSGAWIDADFAESWFVDGTEVRAAIKRGRDRDLTAAAHRVTDEVMPQRRAEWAERFLLLALRSLAAKDRIQKRWANDFLVLADSLCGSRDLASIPLMDAIARHTVEVARIARW